MNLIYFSPVPWSSFAQRPQKFVEWFNGETGGKVLWVDPYPTRFPTFGDIRRLYRKSTRSNVHVEKPPWLQVILPSSVPIEPFLGLNWVNGVMLRPAHRFIMDFAGREPATLVIGKPSAFAVEILKQLNEIPSMYDAMDDFPSFYTGLSRFAMEYRERQVVSLVGRMIVSSSSLALRWRKVRPDVQLIPNGFDPDMVPIMEVSRPRDKGRTIGYIGTIGAWFDWEWVIALAENRKNNLVRLIGPICSSPPKNLPKNIQLLPECSHEKAMEAMVAFDVGIIPFKRTLLTLSVDPIKYYEYKAIGLPIVSTRFGEMASREGEQGVYLADSKSELGEVIGMADCYSPDDVAIMEFRLKNSWKFRFDSINLNVDLG